MYAVRLLAVWLILGGMATATEEKDKGGRPPKKPLVTPEELAAVALNPKGRHHLTTVAGISHEDARIIKRVSTLTVEEFQAVQKEKLQEAMDMALDQTKATIHKASALQAATVYGILGDKHSKPGPTNQTLHIHLAAGDRSGAIAALLGKHGERVSGEGANQTKPVGIKQAGPVIDLETPEPGPILRTGDSQSPTKLPK